MNIDIAIVAWPNHPARMDYCRQTIVSLKRYLAATGYTLRYVCSSESARDPARSWHGDELVELCRAESISLSFRDGPPGLGENMNAALRLCTADLILLVQDDRPAIKPLDLKDGADYLLAHRDVDLVRYAWPHGRCKLYIHPDGWRRFDMRGHWPYGDEPHLRRRDFMDRWGWYREEVRFGASEGIMLHHLAKGGAMIVAADDIYFGHLGFVEAAIDSGRYRMHLR